MPEVWMVFIALLPLVGVDGLLRIRLDGRLRSVRLGGLVARQRDGELRVGLGPPEQTLGALVVAVLHGDVGLPDLLVSELQVKLRLRLTRRAELRGAPLGGLRVGQALRRDGIARPASERDERRGE